MPDISIVVEAPAMHCPQCMAEYVSHQHPMKPPGVVMMRTCRCEPVTHAIPGGTITVMVPPELLP